MANENQNLTNPENLVDVSMLGYFEDRIGQKYATKEEAGATHASTSTCEDIISELT